MDDGQVPPVRQSQSWSLPQQLIVAALICVPLLVGGFATFVAHERKQHAIEMHAVYTGSVAALTESLGAPSSESGWHAWSEWFQTCRRYTEWAVEPQQVSPSIKVVESIVRQEAGVRVFPNEEEAAELGTPRTIVEALENNFRPWLEAGVGDNGQFRVVVFAGRC